VGNLWKPVMTFYVAKSCTTDFGALLLTDVMPFLQDSFVVYASLLAITSPLEALSRHLRLPALSLKISNCGLGMFFTAVMELSRG